MRIAEQNWGAWGPAQILETEQWRLKWLPGFGGTLIELFHRPSATQLLRVPSGPEVLAQEPYVYGMPLLFPAGRIAGGICRVGNTVWHWPQNDSAGPNHLHGFLWNTPFDRGVESAPGHVRFMLAASTAAHLQEMMGQPLSVSVEYTVGTSVEIAVEVRNLGDGFVPFGLGFHMNVLLERPWTVRLPEGKEWVMGRDLMPTGEFWPAGHALQGLDSGRPAADLVCDTCYRVTGPGLNQVQLCDPDGRLRARLTCSPPFTQWVFYRPRLDSNFLSVEPYTWVHNAPNLPLSPEVTGMARLEPGHAVRSHVLWEIE